jgi:hypothetical protein
MTADDLRQVADKQQQLAQLEQKIAQVVAVTVDLFGEELSDSGIIRGRAAMAERIADGLDTLYEQKAEIIDQLNELGVDCNGDDE